MGTGRTSETLGQSLIAGLREVQAVLARGDRLEDHFIVHEVRPAIEPRRFNAAQVRALRGRLNMSQAVLARLMAVSARTIQAWERGATAAPPMARRMLEAIEADPNAWIELVYRRRQVGSAARAPKMRRSA